MKNRMIVFGLVFMMLAMLAGCSSSGSGVVPIVTIEGVELTIGASDIYTLLETDQAFTANVVGGILSPGAKLDGNSWLSKNIYFVKDNTRYATVRIYNPDKAPGYTYSCPISKLTVTSENTDTLVNGIDFFEMDSASVKQTMQSYKLARETDTGALRYEDGNYNYFFSFDKKSGLVSEITAEIVFQKSYKENLG